MAKSDFDPDKRIDADDPEAPTLGRCRAWALAGVEGFVRARDGSLDTRDDLEAEIQDLITDLLHLCDSEPGCSALQMLRVARNNWRRER